MQPFYMYQLTSFVLSAVAVVGFALSILALLIIQLNQLKSFWNLPWILIASLLAGCAFLAYRSIWNWLVITDDVLTVHIPTGDLWVVVLYYAVVGALMVSTFNMMPSSFLRIAPLVFALFFFCWIWLLLKMNQAGVADIAAFKTPTPEEWIVFFSGIVAITLISLVISGRQLGKSLLYSNTL